MPILGLKGGRLGDREIRLREWVVSLVGSCELSGFNKRDVD